MQEWGWDYKWGNLGRPYLRKTWESRVGNFQTQGKCELGMFKEQQEGQGG